MKNPEPFINNAAFRAFVAATRFETARRVLLRGVMPLVQPPAAARGLERRVAGHFRRCFPVWRAGEVEARARAFSRHWASKLAEDFIALNYPSVERYRADVERLVVYEGFERLAAAAGRGRGVLMVGAHLGSVAYCTNALLAMVYAMGEGRTPRVRFCAEPEVERFPTVMAHLERALRGYGTDVAFIRTRREPRAVAGEMAETLRAGGVVTTNLDVLMGGRSQALFPLFGGRIHVRLPALVGAARMALRTGATVLPWVSYRTRRGFLIQVEPPTPTADPDGTAQDDLCEALRARLERWILRAPEQWFYWDRLHRRLEHPIGAPGGSSSGGA